MRMEKNCFLLIEKIFNLILQLNKKTRDRKKV